MLRRKKRRKPPYEIYDLGRSPLSQKPTQRDLASLAKVPKIELNRQLWYKETCIVRRSEVISGKNRDLVYPTGPLRATHERFKYHLNKVIQPDYLMSPRKGRSQRDNAEVHLDQLTYLTLDIRKFYPSTSYSMVRKWCVKTLGMYDDVARLFAGLSTVDDVVAFGSPLTPVLVALVHRELFDEIFQYCEDNDLNMSLWVDDLTISGQMITGDTIRFIREAIGRHGLRSHKLDIRTGNKTVFITGVGIVGSHLVAPRLLHEKIRDKWADYHEAETIIETNACADRLLSMMGTVRHIVGAKTDAGRKLADRMNSLRQDRRQKQLRESDMLKKELETLQQNTLEVEDIDTDTAVPWV